ncbi:MAG: DUF1810 domain-containing protein [Pseudomonadota bacterium]
MTTDDPFDLERFVVAQDPLYGRVIVELGQGRKTSHWMWFIFPQIAGLGRSPTSMKYSISGLQEAKAYLGHEVLGKRLRDCVNLLLRLQEVTAVAVFGGVDSQKLRSSMTLFGQAAPQDGCFQAVLDRFFDGKGDPATLAILEEKK